MWPSSLDYLICPDCHNPSMIFRESSSKNYDNPTKTAQRDGPVIINEGQITCPSCSRKYPILNGIPILLKDNSVNVDAGSLFEPSDEHLDYTLESTKKVARLLSEHKVDTALDVACGLGANTPYFRCNTLISFDLSPYFVMKCVENETMNASRHWFVADVLNIPFKKNTFDLIFASNILEHLKPLEVESVVGTLNSLLRNDGIIQIDVPNSSGMQELLRKIMTRFSIYGRREFNEHPELGHHSLFVTKDLKELGFEVHGCIGWVTRKKLPLGFIWELYDLIGWYVPPLAGTLIGLRRGRRG